MTNLASQGLSAYIPKKPKPFIPFVEIRTVDSASNDETILTSKNQNT